MCRGGEVAGIVAPLLLPPGCESGSVEKTSETLSSWDDVWSLQPLTGERLLFSGSRGNTCAESVIFPGRSRDFWLRM